MMTYGVLCDRCGDHFVPSLPSDGCRSSTEARLLAAFDGWARTKNQDVCPQCCRASPQARVRAGTWQRQRWLSVLRLLRGQDVLEGPRWGLTAPERAALEQMERLGLVRRTRTWTWEHWDWTRGLELLPEEEWPAWFRALCAQSETPPHAEQSD